MAVPVVRDKPKRRTRCAKRVFYCCLYLFVAFDVVFVVSFAHRNHQKFSFDWFLPRFKTKNLAHQHQHPHPHPHPPTRSDFFMSFEDELTTAEGQAVEDECCQIYDTFGCLAIENLHDTENETDFRWIRVENEPDRSIQDNMIQSPEDVFRRIEEVKAQQSQFGECSLYPRNWEPANHGDKVEDGDADGVDLFSGDHVNGLDTNTKNRVFSVMQLNALAEGLSSGPNVMKPFVIPPGDNHTKCEKEKSGYGGFTSIPFPEISLDFSLRRWRVMEIILTSNRESSLFDLIAMEEVDRYRGFFRPLLRLFGYEGRFMPKTRAPGVLMGWYSDGCCLFWKKETFEHVSDVRREYRVGNQVYIIATLRHIPTGRIVVTAVTHLKAQKGDEQERVRCLQVVEILDEIAKRVSILLKEGEKAVSVLILGDFNAEPPAHTDMQEGAIKKVLEFSLVTVPNRRQSPIQSAYKIIDAEGFYTTWKTRGTVTTKRIIDYIFYSAGSITCQATLQVPLENQLETTKLPGLRHPSDHMLIAAKFKIE